MPSKKPQEVCKFVLLLLLLLGCVIAQPSESRRQNLANVGNKGGQREGRYDSQRNRQGDLSARKYNIETSISIGELPKERLQEKKSPEEGLQEKKLPEDGLQEHKILEEGLQEKKLPEEGLQEKKSPEEGLQEKKLPDEGLQEQKLPEKGLQEKKSPEEGLQEKNLPEEGLQGKKSPEEGLQEKKIPEAGLKENEGDPQARSPFEEEILRMIGYMRETLTESFKDDDFQTKGTEIIRGAIGEGPFKILNENSRWYFYGFKEGRVLLRGKPPDLLATANEIKIFGFDTIVIQLTRTGNCIEQRYKVLFPRAVMTFKERDPQEILMVQSYDAEIKYCNKPWDPYEIPFFEFMKSLACAPHRPEDENELLAQVAWYISSQIESKLGPYTTRVHFCRWCGVRLSILFGSLLTV